MTSPSSVPVSPLEQEVRRIRIVNTTDPRNTNNPSPVAAFRMASSVVRMSPVSNTRQQSVSTIGPMRLLKPSVAKLAPSLNQRSIAPCPVKTAPVLYSSSGVSGVLSESSKSIVSSLSNISLQVSTASSNSNQVVLTQSQSMKPTYFLQTETGQLIRLQNQSELVDVSKDVSKNNSVVEKNTSIKTGGAVQRIQFDSANIPISSKSQIVRIVGQQQPNNVKTILPASSIGGNGGFFIPISSSRLVSVNSGIRNISQSASGNVNQLWSQGNRSKPLVKIAMSTPTTNLRPSNAQGLSTNSTSVSSFKTSGQHFDVYQAFLKRKDEKHKNLNGSLSNLANNQSESDGVKLKKPCNCTKSQCLKLYCDCFANGEFCFNCNCTNCFNNLSHEEERQHSIKQCLDRNVNAFKPKICRITNDGERRHNKGCNCKRSNCLKNYCECFEAKIPCTDACRCTSCKNVEESTGRKKETLSPFVDDIFCSESFRTNSQKSVTPAETHTSPHVIESILGTNSASSQIKHHLDNKQRFTFVTPDVVEAMCECLLAQAEQSELTNEDEATCEAKILHEFGLCLQQIIELANAVDREENSNVENDDGTLED